MTKTKIRNTMFAIVTLILTLTAVAQDSQGSGVTIRSRVTITVTVDGLNCTTPAGPGTFSALAWKFGVTETSTTGGGGASKPNFSNFNITKHFNACSSALFEAVLLGKFFKTVTIIQQDTNNDDVLTVTLSDALLSGYQLGGELGHELPTEQLSFAFSKIMISESKSGAKIDWSPTSDK